MINNSVLIVPVIYPIISGVCSILISLFGLFSPFICTERDFINETNWYISQLRGMRIDKLKGFISEVFNSKISEIIDNDTNSINNAYIKDIYECFADDVEECICIDNEIRNCLKRYKYTNTSFMLVLWFAVAIVVTSLLCKYIEPLNFCLNFLFYVTIILIVVQLANIIYLRYLCIHSQDIYQNKIFRGKQK